MNKEKIKLSFVNNKEEFILPTLTVEIHEEIMEDMVEVEKKINPKGNEKKYAVEANKYMILRVLQKVDPSVKYENVSKLHPDDFYLLIAMINTGGRELSSKPANFQKKNLNQQKKN
jgi:hypothetical protein